MQTNISQEKWNNLCQEAEDILLEEEIGQYIVGIYQVPPVIEGQITIFCLYIDPPENLLDPFRKTKDKTIATAKNDELIAFRNLWDWIADLKTGEDFAYSLISSTEPIFEEDYIEPIIRLIGQYQSSKDPKILRKISKTVISLYKTFL